MIYGLRRMIYLLRKHDIISVPQYAEGIYHRTIVRYHTEGISPVPSGTDIIEKSPLSVDKSDFFRGGGGRIRKAALSDMPVACRNQPGSPAAKGIRVTARETGLKR